MKPVHVIVGRLGSQTCGCLDLHDRGLHVHSCEAHAGGIVHASDDDEYVSGQPDYSWQIGTEVRLHAVDCSSGAYPHCTRVARYADPLVEDTADSYPEAPTGSFVSPFHEGADDEAFYQWKGTTTWLTFTCACGVECSIEGEDFVYNVMCPACHAVYNVDSHVKFERVEDPSDLCTGYTGEQPRDRCTAGTGSAKAGSVGA